MPGGLFRQSGRPGTQTQSQPDPIPRCLCAGTATFALPPQARQVSTSILNTRFSLCAQVIATFRLPLPRLAGVTHTRCLLFGAKTPWNREDFEPSAGTIVAGFRGDQSEKETELRSNTAGLDARGRLFVSYRRPARLSLFPVSAISYKASHGHSSSIYPPGHRRHLP